MHGLAEVTRATPGIGHSGSIVTRAGICSSSRSPPKPASGPLAGSGQNDQGSWSTASPLGIPLPRSSTFAQIGGSEGKLYESRVKAARARLARTGRTNADKVTIFKYLIN